MARVFFSDGTAVEGSKGNVKRAIKTMQRNFPGIKYRFSEPFCDGNCDECLRSIPTGWGVYYCDYKNI